MQYKSDESLFNVYFIFLEKIQVWCCGVAFLLCMEL